MSKSFGALEFKYKWRSYQSNLLKNFNSHISDNHFHVIAPPGSGKTILGIEIIRRLNKKTLVLAPTLTIRNQWENRLQSFFSKKGVHQPLSFDLKSPSDITFSTYQSLHAFYKTFEDKKDYYAFFEKHQIETLVLDEAHHLKNEWWNCLMALKNNISFYIVALTATPPYDSSRTEISKYFGLCGDIDDEIAVPDLVKETDLCPHQDYVYLSRPEDLEINFIVEYRQKIAVFMDTLLKDEKFISFLKAHRYFDKPKKYLEELYSNTEYFSSVLIFLNASGVQIDTYKLSILGFNKGEVINFPKLSPDWLEILFQNVLVNDREQLAAHETYLLSLGKELRRLNVFDKKKVDFVGEDLLYKSLSNSSSKLKSIVTIVSAERENLKSGLRCVILTDYIRKEFLNIEESSIQNINKIGVTPIFQHLRSYYSNKNELGILTGSLVLIHHSILEDFSQIENRDHFSFTSLQIDSSFVVVSSKKKSKKSIVSIITKLFEKGKIKVLIGTKSLLGEGWDAPSINSLILASFVGSFVSSNQMRGRAIRKDPQDANKTGSIWHLACIDPTVSDGGRDMHTLKRRFEAFVGISNDSKPYIENGFERLGFPTEILEENIQILNEATLKKAMERGLIVKHWHEAVDKGSHMIKQVKMLLLGKRSFNEQKQIYYFDIIKFFVAELFFSIMLFSSEFILKNIHLVLQRGALCFIYALLAVFSVSFGYKLYKAIKLYIQYGYLYKKIKKIGFAILDTLHELGYITTLKDSVSVQSSLMGKGDVVCNLVGASQYENALFSNALSEILAPIESPRYLIIKTNMFRSRLNIENFYPVPEIFGDKKGKALVFQKYWGRYMGNNKLFYTRRIDGRKLLLKARLFHVYNAFNKVSKEVLAWK